MGIAGNVQNTMKRLLEDPDLRCVATLKRKDTTQDFGGYSGDETQTDSTDFNCIPTRNAETAIHNDLGELTGGSITLIVNKDFTANKDDTVTYNSVDYSIEEIRPFHLGNETGNPADNKSLLKIVDLSRKF